MAGSSNVLNIIGFVLCIAVINKENIISGHRLNVPRVLLPIFNDFPINFTLEVTEEGCYQWSTSRSDIVQLLPFNENAEHTCSSSVLVQTVTKDSTRNTAIVLAEDINTGQLLRCDVIVDAIFSLKIVTTTRELFIEEAPEAFEVRAYDEQGNEFTTLAGVEFTWSINNIDKRGLMTDNKSLNNVLRFMTFQESPYETPTTISALDLSGKRGHIALLEGIRTGTAKVSVKLPHTEYRHIPPDEVELIVVANLIILPSDVTMMTFDCFKYKIMQVQQGRLENIILPSSQYYLEAEIPEMLEISDNDGSTYALAKGKTKVFLNDRNVYEEYGVILPSATVHVNDVAYIRIAVLPNRNWALIVGQPHEIIVELFDDKDHKFHIGEGVEVNMEFEKQYIDTKFITQNGTYTIGVPLMPGTTLVEATLYGVIDKQGRRINISPHLTARAEFIIHHPVVVHPHVLAVPWDVKSKSQYDASLKASGGDGSYTWSSRNPSIVAVTQSGIIRTLQKGSTEVIVSMTRNRYNRDMTKLHVLPPSKLEIIRYSMEGAVGEPIHIHIALYGSIVNGAETKEIPFNDCKNIPFEVYISEDNFVQNREIGEIQPVGIACATITVVATNVGTSGITIAYNAQPQYLMDNITIMAYEPLKAVHPVSAETLLAVGTSRKIVFSGGPYPWPGKSQGYTRELRNSNEKLVETMKYQSSETSSDIAIFDVICKALGEVTLTFTVWNTPLLPNCMGTEASAVVRVICGKPRYIYLQPEFKDGSNCPIGQNADRIMAHGNTDLELTVVVKDEDGRHFDNITSLYIEWDLIPSTASNVEASNGAIEETFTDMYVQLPKRHFQRIIPRRHTGSLTVHAKVTGYQMKILKKLKLSSEWPLFPIETPDGALITPLIEASVNIILVNDTVITPNALTILNDPNGKYSLQVSQGSGYYEFVLSSDDIADVRYIEPTKTISIVPKKSGSLHIALVDLCLVSNPAEAIIEVQQLTSIEVEAVNKVEKGKCISLALKFYDTNGNIIQLPSVDALQIKVEIENGHIDIKKLPLSEQGSQPLDEIRYTIYGVEEGEARVTFSSGEDDQEIRSEPFVVQVILPLKVSPKNITALVSTIYQIATTGGPTDAEIEFIAENDEIVNVDQYGLFEGKSIGQSRIIVRAVGFNMQGNKIVYSQDYAEVHVIYLDGIKIVVPTTRIKVGATVPLWAFGIPEHLTPLVIGSMKSPLRFIWSSSDPNLLSLHNVYENTGINIRYQNEVAIRAKALKSGLVAVYLNVTAPSKISGYKTDTTYSTFVRIDIFEELSLVFPENANGTSVLLMAPNSVMQLQTNRDKHGLTTYKILSSRSSNDSDDPNALIAAVRSVTIEKNGLVRSGDIFGKTVISVTNIEAHGLKQTLILVIDVKPIHYVMLSLQSNLRIRSGEELNMLPKGMELNYILEYYDAVGAKFHGANTNLKVLGSRTDLVSFATIPENIITVKFLDNGELITKVYNEKYPNGMFDYVRMLIGDVLFPTKTTLTVGDIVCFSMPLLSSDGEPGQWQSSAPEILSVDSINGIGRARNSGQTIVKHSLATQVQGEIKVNVQAISKISIVPLRTSSFAGMETFSIPLVLKSKDERIKENNVLARGLGGCRTYSSFILTSFPFTCNIEFVSSFTFVNIKDIFLARPRFDIVTGFYYCDIIPVCTPSVVSSTLEARIKINAQSRDINGVPVEVTYLPPIYVSTKEIFFVSSPVQTVPSATIEIHGLRPVLEHVVIDAPDGITVSEQQFASKNVLQYKVRLLQNQEELQGQKIIISNDLTKQNISIFIRVSKHDHFVQVLDVHWLDYLYFHRYTFATFIVLVATYFYIWKNKMSNINMTIKNKSIFAEKCPPPIKKTPCCPTPGNVSCTPSPHSPSTPFSAFEPVYGDPRGFYTPNSRRSRALHYFSPPTRTC
ncbi:nuclear pore membrane glycoprotein 210 [Orussus abietinus]|uniref:nuclear pore membrane glycoprotein 210 n=1 Tax=Orussus abietinus TaxID=222816 RepID=UPI000626EB38|nr:nuclear pore membrane glycoprotein 210 [Orussus abietinus]